MTTHIVKSWSHFFNAIVDGSKKHDLRDMADRDYQVGDEIVLREYDQFTGQYSGRAQSVRITFITDERTPCAFSSAVLQRGYAILSLEKIGPVYTFNE